MGEHPDDGQAMAWVLWLVWVVAIVGAACVAMFGVLALAIIRQVLS